VANPSGAIAETNSANDTTSLALHIRTRPDLTVTAIAPTDPPRQGIATTVAVSVSDGGETDAPTQSVCLYDGDPDNGGTQIGCQDAAVAAGATVVLSLPWTPATLGDRTLYADADSNGTVSESDEVNNRSTAATHVGWGAPVSVDAGGSGEQAYDPSVGYGYLTAGTVHNTCGTDAAHTYRQADSGTQMQYQFDHLLPGRFYHLDLTFSLCSGTRTERVLVDGKEAANPVSVGTTPTTISVVVDPSTYDPDHTIVVALEALPGTSPSSPVVSVLNLTDIRYCYRDAGSLGEISYAQATDGCGYTAGTADQGWGGYPYQTYRFDDGDGLTYRFDSLDPAKAYQLDLTFYDKGNSGRTDTVTVDGQTVLAAEHPGPAPHYVIEAVPTASVADGTITVAITGAFATVAEIALEETTAQGSAFNKLANPGFESGPSRGWPESSSAGRELISSALPHAGLMSAHECGIDNCTEYVQQQLIIPAGGSLSYWWYMTSTDSTTIAKDGMLIELYSSRGVLLRTLKTRTNKDTRNTWILDTINLGSWTGKTVILRFTTRTNSTKPTDFYIDDVSVK